MGRRREHLKRIRQQVNEDLPPEDELSVLQDLRERLDELIEMQDRARFTLGKVFLTVMFCTVVGAVTLWLLSLGGCLLIRWPR